MAKDSNTRGIRDEMNVGPDPRQARHLKPLGELGKLRVADGEPDVRGWDVYTSTGREIGVVHELLVDTEAGEVVMLDVDLKRNDRHTLAPVRAAWIDHAANRVIINAAEVQGAEELPSLARSAPRMTDEEATSFDERYGRVYGADEDDREYRVRHGDEELRFSRRAADLGNAGDRGMEIDVERDVDRDVPRRSQWVERHPLEEPDRYRPEESGEGLVRYRRRDDRPRQADAASRPEEEVVLERRPYVEEVVVRRRAADEAVGGQGGATSRGDPEDRLG
ncbi:MAG TPA: PRC-barrel domain-containing protein [Gemmatimonadales bacterium]